MRASKRTEMLEHKDKVVKKIACTEDITKVVWGIIYFPPLICISLYLPHSCSRGKKKWHNTLCQHYRLSMMLTELLMLTILMHAFSEPTWLLSNNPNTDFIVSLDFVPILGNSFYQKKRRKKEEKIHFLGIWAFCQSVTMELFGFRLQRLHQEKNGKR